MAGSDAKVVDTFRQYLSDVSRRKFRLIERPDTRDRTGSACDAIFECGHHKYAVEHSSIDSFLKQRLDDDRFTKVLVSVEQALQGVFDEYVEFKIPVHSIPTGINWEGVSNRIERWCRDNIGSIPYNKWTCVSIPGVPFPAEILKDQRLDFGFFVSRRSPEDLEDQRLAVIRTMLETRATKLPQYKKRGCRTILLSECHDIAFGHFRLIGEAFHKAVGELNMALIVDDAFLVLTRIDPFKFFCLKLGDKLWPESMSQWQGYSVLC